MKNKIITTLSISLIMLASSFAQANLIVDTGSNSNGAQYQFDENQYFAGQFTTTQDWNINSLEAFISNNRNGNPGTDGTVEYALWSNSFNTPSVKIFSGTSVINAGSTAAWHGLFGLSELLNAGTYWISATPSAGVSGFHYGEAPNPLQNYYLGNDTGWVFSSSFDNGFRISATQAVSEPSTLAILALGLMGIAIRKFKKQL